MTRILTLFAVGFFFIVDLAGQGSAFGIKAGPTLGYQRGTGAQSSVMIGYHGIAYIESLPAGNANAFFAQAGYHQRGSARRIRRFGNGFTTNSIIPRGYIFNNVGLALGFKQKFDWNYRKAYYLLGFRGEYTLNHNLKDFQDIVFVNQFGSFNSNFYYPHPIGVQKWNYGFMAGAGVEFDFSDVVGGLIELTINPDLSPQYNMIAIPNVFDPISGNSITIPERKFYNLSIELTIGLRLLRIIEYVD